jgi:hypothetical protein
MSVDWRAADQIRTVQGKRRAIEVLGAQIAEAERDLDIALAFEGEYNGRLNDIERRIGAASNGYSPYAGLVWVANGEDREALIAERDAIEREKADAIADRTVTSADAAGFRLSYCPVRVNDVQKRLRHLRTAREMKARELADLEGTLSPGLMCESGIPAPDYVAHRERVEAGRAS